MKKIITICWITLFTLISFARDYKDVKYVFLFIGDGMSLPQRTAAEEYLRKHNLPPLEMNRLPYQSPTTTRSADRFITDSAASGTAIACGEKVPNKYIGMNAKKENLVSVADVAKRDGMKVGIITSVYLNHATPAAFYGHSSARSDYYKLGLDLIESNFDFFGGGTLSGRYDKKSPLYKGDLLTLAKEFGYKLALSESKINGLKKGDNKVIAIPYPDSTIPYLIDNPNSMRISHLLAKAIELLDNDKGFFIMTEGGKIDWMCHANDLATVVNEVIDMDNALKVALKFAKKYPKETLIIVTADHETGGLTLGSAGTGYESYFEFIPNQKCSQFTFEQKVKKLLKENADIEFAEVQQIITENFGLIFGSKNKNDRMALTSDEEQTLRKAFDMEKKPSKKRKDSGKEAYEQKKNPLAASVIKIFNRKLGVAWTSDAHTALPVITSAYGTNAEAFVGTLDNTNIAKILKDIID